MASPAVFLSNLPNVHASLASQRTAESAVGQFHSISVNNANDYGRLEFARNRLSVPRGIADAQANQNPNYEKTNGLQSGPDP